MMSGLRHVPRRSTTATKENRQRLLGLKMAVAKTTIAVLILVLLSIAVTCTSGEPVEFPISTSNIDGVLSLPLLTYGTLKRRRMLEMGLDEDSMDSYLESLTTKNRQHHQPNASRRTSLEVGGLYQGYGTHYVDLWVGTPPQRQTVIVDTGSGVTAFPCSACSDCGQKYHASPYFVEADSSTFLKNKCDPCWDRGSCQSKGKNDEYCKIGVSYQEGSSWTAYQAVDQTYLGGPHHHPLDTTGVDEGSVEAGSGGEGNHLGSGVVDEDPADAAKFRFPLRFGCQTKITGLFKTQLADGIMGMCNQKGAFWHQMYDAKVIVQQQFSLCFSRQNESERDGTVAGAVTMGGTDTNLHASPMVFAEGFVNGGIMHGLSIRKVYFMEAGQYEAVDATPKNTKVLDIKYEILNRGRVILDSGTTDTYFTRDIGSTFRTVFKKMVGVAYDTKKGMVLTDEQVAAIPSMIVQLTGHKLSNELKFNPKDPDATPGLAGKLDSNHPNDVLVVVTPNAYFDYNSQKSRYFPRIFPTEGSGTVLGANFMAGHDVLFDIPNNGRIGFASSDCSYGNLVNGTHPTRPPSSGRVAPGTLTKNSSKDKFVCESHIYCQYRLSIFMVAVILLLGIRSGYGRYKESRAEYRRAQTEILNDLYLDSDDEDVVARGERIDDGVVSTNGIQMRDMSEIS